MRVETRRAIGVVISGRSASVVERRSLNWNESSVSSLAEPLLDDVEALERRRLHFFVRPAPEHRAQHLLDVAFARQLVRQPVANALR